MQFSQLLDKKPPGVVLSPSQIEKYDRCKRLWALEYIGGIKPTPHPSAQLGTDVHTILEAWLMYGKPPDIRTKAGKIAAKMIVNLPLPGTGITERQFWLITRNGLSYTGKIDWSGIFYDWPTVVDHKTTSNLNYAKSAEQLHSDTQGLTYTIAGCMGFEVDEVQLLWNYGTTKDKEPIIVPSRTKVRLQLAVEKFENVVDPLAAEIVAARQSRRDPMSFPPTPSACGDFGGCPHQHICKISQEERLRALMTGPAQPTLASRLESFPAAGGFMPPGQQPAFTPGQNGPFMATGPASIATGGPAFTPPGQQPAFTPGQNGPVMATGPASIATGGPAFTPPGQQQAYVPPQQGTFSPPGNGMPMTQPQVVPGSVQLPAFSPPGMQPGMQPQQQQQVYHPNQGPNPPESGVVVPPSAEGDGKPKRGRGRPKKSESEDTESSSILGLPITEQSVFAAGMVAFMRHPQWDGTPEKLRWAGDMAVNVFKQRFG